MFRGSSVQKIFVQKVLCSDGLLFRRSHVQKVLCSEIFVQKVLYSEGPICSEDPIFRKYLFGRFYIQKVPCSEGPIFRRSFVQKVLCWNTFPSFSFRYKNISCFFFISFITLLFTSMDTREWVPKLRRSRELQISKSSNFPGLGNPEPKFRSSVVMRGVLRCVFFVIDWLIFEFFYNDIWSHFCN